MTGFEGAYDSKSVRAPSSSGAEAHIAQAQHKVNEWKDWNPSGKQDPKLQAWLDGRTGVPMVDANILELKNTCARRILFH